MKNDLGRTDPKRKKARILYSLQEVASSLVIAIVDSGLEL
jgi:hypothetical protein